MFGKSVVRWVVVGALGVSLPGPAQAFAQTPEDAVRAVLVTYAEA